MSAKEERRQFIVPEDLKKIPVNRGVAISLLKYVIDNQDDPVITYGDLTKKLPFNYNPRNLDKPLGVISNACLANDLPPISSIVVNKGTRLPGSGFYREFYSGSSVDKWKDIFEKNKFAIANCAVWNEFLEAINGSLISIDETSSMVTRTTNQLHFEDLDPIRFEELILSMVYRMRKWDRLDHYGKKGSDDGLDISAVETLENGKRNTYHFQCKRYQKMSNHILRRIVDDYISKNDDVPDIYILVVSCTLTKKQIDYFESYCSNHGFMMVNIWTNSIIEAMLYSEYPDLLFIYFNINLLSNTWQMKQKRYDCIKKYLDDFNRNMETFEYRGEPKQTFFCLRDVFGLDLDKLKCLKKMHKNNDYLFKMENNKIIYAEIENIDNVISEFVNKYSNTGADKQLEIAEWMDKICMQISNLVNSYTEMIKREMSDILFYG